MTFSFVEYVRARDERFVSGNVEVYFRDAALFAEVLAAQRDRLELERLAGVPACATAINHWVPAEKVVAA